MPAKKPLKNPINNSLIKNKIHIIIEGTDTPAGKLFDVLILVAIVTSVLVVMFDSVLFLRLQYGRLFFVAEWFFTVLFTIEYALRLYSSPNRRRYVTSFYGVVDLLALLPTYLSLFFAGTHYLLVVRILRILRIFRVFRLKSYMQQAGFLAAAFKTSQHKITVFFLSLLLLVTIFGSVLYVVEGPENGFTSIPLSIYWAVVTLTTVGYGDISPKTPIGQAIASMVMITGYAIIAVPTGIFTAELTRTMRPQLQPISCPNCGKFGHATNAKFCDRCGHDLHV
ncbi:MULTISPECIES: ion transporter [Moraxella]|uniref:Potassium voltage-gated channel subfamily KQT n=1 Tax=Moraxella catarrhalis TaxID=480 RepID=A0A198UZB2_MORCA|nr:ion transporter [Moraxella catarrhalis]OAU95067.1 Potassium voltage-gated channel subfamily KQT [Moraxella catarrhalis]OAU95326.1 Potassium voltage-gated channel subfamily KQT [Moraxella catarrhalis]OAU98291.1 Potassium voltage-gated channel subfamily KQT [Moraxella catarrhalis]OAV01864.1 Potassium voltage-gated channel subfamily KQT [Moraxella catarrhalis]